MEKVTIKANDGYILHLKVYDVENSKGVVQVLHGMEEWQDRYTDFALALNQAGYSVVTSNMRGHGEDAPILGYFSEKNGYKLLISDQIQITDYILNRFQIEKIILFGHSMGTIIARNLMHTQCSRYDKVILSGYPCENIGAYPGMIITGLLALFKGVKYHSKFVENIAIGGYNKSIHFPKTKSDWLSYNEENIQFYLASPYCGHGFSVSAYKDLFYLVKDMHKHFVEIDPALPILLMSGRDDPVTGFHKGVLSTVHALENIGFQQIQYHEYEHMRHEILQETNKEEVIKDIITFLDSKRGN